jgi:hypothetical protein
MSLLTTASVRQRANKVAPTHFSAGRILAERMEKQASAQTFDIFLSHAFDDKELILGVALVLEDLGHTVYLDWRDDPTLDRKNVNAATAAMLRIRMRQSRCLFYATTENSSNSKWMPWELGYKDGHSNLCAILPIQASLPRSFKGQEYLGIYPYITQERDTAENEELWVRRSATCYVIFESWLAGIEPIERG